MASNQQDQEIEFLEAVFEADQKSTEEPASLDHLEKRFGVAQEQRISQGLLHRGLIETEKTFEGGYYITPAGRTVVENVRSRRANKSMRRRACRAHLLEWLGDREATTSGARVPRNEMDVSLDQVPFTDAEAGAAARWLRHNGLVVGLDLGEEDNALLWLTDAGQECIEDGVTPEDFVKARNAPAASPVFNMGGEGNTYANAFGEHSTATANVTNVDLAAIRLLAQAIRQAAPVMDLPDEYAEHVTVIETTDDPGAAQRALARLVLFLNDTGSGALGGLIASLAAGYVQTH